MDSQTALDLLAAVGHLTEAVWCLAGIVTGFCMWSVISSKM